MKRYNPLKNFTRSYKKLGIGILFLINFSIFLISIIIGIPLLIIVFLGNSFIFFDYIKKFYKKV